MARTPKTAHDTSKPLSRRVLVNIKRDQTTTTPRVVWQHEVPILEAMHGEGNVQTVEPETLDEGFTPRASVEMLMHNKRQDAFRPPSANLGLGYIFTGNVRAEYERMANCYGSHPTVAESWCENVYGRFQGGTFASIIGTPELEDLPQAQLRQLLIDFGYQLPIADYKDSEAVKDAAVKGHAAFRDMPTVELMKLAEAHGVELG